MTTPFSSEYAKAFIRDILDVHARQNDVIVYIEQSAFEAFDDRWTDREDSDPPVPEEYSIEAWTGCCLLDAALNGTDYTGDCTGYAEEYRTALDAVKGALSKKKFLSRKPVHDANALRRTACDILMTLDDDEGTELGKRLFASGDYEAFVNALIALSDRLEPDT